MLFEEQITEIITGLIINAITRTAGPMARAAGILKPGRPPDWLVAPITRSAKENVVSMLAALSDAAISETSITRAAQALDSIEAQNLERTLVVEALAQKSQEAGAVRAQLIAILTYIGNCDREDAKLIAPHLEFILIENTLKARDTIQAASRRYYAVARQLAQQELAAGYIEDIGRTISATSDRPSIATLTAIDQFVVDYITETKARTAELIPQHFDMQTRIPIDELYVVPHFFARTEDVQRVAPMSRDIDLTVEHITFPFHHAMRRMYRTVVLGAPGAGKTTLTQKMMHDLCASPTMDQQCVPFLVTLRKYQQAKNDSRLSFADYISKYITSEHQIAVPKGAVEYLLKTGRAVAIFDGLDELLHLEQRRSIARAVESFGRRYPESSVVVTSRVRGYSEVGLNSRIYTHMYLEELDDKAVKEYARKWYSANPGLTGKEMERIATEFLRDSETVSDLRSNPLLLSLMCNIYKGAGYIPQNRADLYERCATMLFDEWDQSRGIDSGGPLRGDAYFALQDIAYWAITEPTLATGIPEARLKQRLTEFLKKTRYGNESDAFEAANELLQLWRGRAWMLTDIGSDSLHSIYHFTHRTFLEYFTGIYLARTSASAKDLWRILRPKTISGEWDVTAQIALQAYGTYRAGAIDEVYNLIIDDAQALSLGAIEALVFACRTLDALRPGPEVIKKLIACALRLVLYTLPCFPVRPDWREYEDQRDDGTPEAKLSVAERRRFEDNPAGWPSNRGKVLFSARHLDEPLALVFKSSRIFHRIAVPILVERIEELLGDHDDEMASRGMLLALGLEDFLSSPLLETDDDIGIEQAEGARPSVHEMWSNFISRAGVGAQISRMSSVNFWLPVIAARKGLWTVSQCLNRTADLSCLFNSDSPFDLGLAAPQKCFAEEVLTRYVAGDGTEEDRAVLSEVGKLAIGLLEEGSFERLVDHNWFAGSSLGDSIINSRFLNTPLSKMDVPQYVGALETNEDVLLGSGVILGVFAEAESWQLADLSEDQLADLRLGPLQVLDEFIFERCIRDSFIFFPPQCLNSQGWEILRTWAERRFNLVYRSPETSFRDYY